MQSNIVIALILTTLAGLSTVIGGFFTFFIKRENLKALSVGLGFSAGVMIYISLTELIPESDMLIRNAWGENMRWLTFLGFAVGVLIAFLIDYFMPDHIDSDLFGKSEDCDGKMHRIKRAGFLTAIVIAVHNFPEGIATFFSAATDIKLGFSIAVAIAIHNIPEGISVALPIYHATKQKRQAILYTFLSGLAEPLGAVIGAVLFTTFLPQSSIMYIYSTVAGIMVYIAFDTLLPLSREYGDGHYSVWGVIFGMFLMSLSLSFL